MNVLKIFIFCFISALAGLSAADCPNVRTQYSGGSYGKAVQMCRLEQADSVHAELRWLLRRETPVDPTI